MAAEMSAPPAEPAPQPVLTTPRLVLRPFEAGDAPTVQRLAGAAEVADTTLNIPHPYLDGMAEGWIATHGPARANWESVTYAITTAADGLVGAVSLRLEPAHRRAELGYWVGVPYWNRGYASEAASAVIRYGFETLELNRIHAHHFTRNPASGRVMEKAGMRREGLLRQHVVRSGRLEDLAAYAILREELAARG